MKNLPKISKPPFIDKEEDEGRAKFVIPNKGSASLATDSVPKAKDNNYDWQEARATNRNDGVLMTDNIFMLMIIFFLVTKIVYLQ